jgi:hypothetical protein
MWPFKKRKYGTCEWDGKSYPKSWIKIITKFWGTVYHRHDMDDESTQFYCCKCNNKHWDKLK